MSFSPTSPVVGSPQIGFTSPTYTLTADTSPDPTGKQYAVTAIGGTQANVTSQAPSAPFTITMFRPKTYKSLKTASDGFTKVSEGKNTYTVLVRKGVNTNTDISVNQDQSGLLTCTLKIDVPVGTDTMDEQNLRAAMSLLIGTLWANSSAITETMVSGIL